MALTKYKIGSLIALIDERNTYGIRDFYGINISKEFMPTVADTEGLDEQKYKVVRKNRFVFSGMQTGRDKCIRLSLYTPQKPIIVSPAYVTFEISALDLIDPAYLFMFFLSPEKDRLGWFYSDSSVRSNLDWDRFCDIDIDLPPLAVQKKYVDVYNSMLSNQRNYEQGLEDLEKAVFAEIDIIKHSARKVTVGDLLEEIDLRNLDGSITNVNQGLNKSVARTAAIRPKT